MSRIVFLRWAPIFFLSILFCTGRVFAQNVGNPSSWQVGAFAGRSLPHGVSKSDDIFTIWGLRLSAPMSSQGGFFDGTYTVGNGSSVTWQSLGLGVSLQVPVQTLDLGAGLGLNMTRYTSDSITGAKTVFGEYLLGSVMTKITNDVLARFDMTFISPPGTSLIFDLGLMYEF